MHILYTHFIVLVLFVVVFCFCVGLSVAIFYYIIYMCITAQIQYGAAYHEAEFL